MIAADLRAAPLAAREDRTVEQLTADLKSTRTGTLTDALLGLSRAGAKGVPGLVTAMRHKERWVRAGALRFLAEMGPLGEAALPDVLDHARRIAHGEWCRIDEGVLTLTLRIRALPRLVTGKPFELEPRYSQSEQADAEADYERFSALYALGRLGQSDMGRLLELICAGDAAITSDLCHSDLAAAFAWSARGQRDAALPVLREIAAKGERERRAMALAGLAAIGRKALDEDTSKLVAELCRSEDVLLRARAIESAGAIEMPCDDARPLIVAALTDANAFVRFQAAFAIRALCQESSTAATALVACLGDASAMVRFGAATELAKFESPAKEAQPALSKCLEDPEARVRAAAVTALGGYVDDAKELATHVRRLLKDPDASVREAARLALQRLEHP